jgi:hypothetical protein
MTQKPPEWPSLRPHGKHTPTALEFVGRVAGYADTAMLTNPSARAVTAAHMHTADSFGLSGATMRMSSKVTHTGL